MKKQLAFVIGGKSVEHEISIITGLQAFNAFDNPEYEPFVLYISKNNEFFIGQNLEDIKNYKDLKKVCDEATRVVLVNDSGQAKFVQYPAKKFGKNFERNIDMAFMCVHGTNVEDGALQGFFKTHDVPIVGCDVEAAALSMDKYAQKLIAKAAGVPVLDAHRFNMKDYENTDIIISKIENSFKYPVIVKPLNLGSSVGINVADDSESLIDAIDDAFLYAAEIIVEPAIKNLREINVSVLGDNLEAEASEIEEPMHTDSILSYEDKYANNAKGGKSKGMASVSRQIPANVPEDMRTQIRDLGVKTFQALSCSGVARIDFLLDGDMNEVYFNEINTIPGSLAFYLWEPLSVSYAELLNKMIDISKTRTRLEHQLTFSFDTNVLENANLGGSKSKIG